MSRIEHEAAASCMLSLEALDDHSLIERYRLLKHEVAGLIEHEQDATSQVSYVHLADMRYIGQAHELTVTIPVDTNGVPNKRVMAQAFSDEHYRTYGHCASGQAIECVTLRIIARVQPIETAWDRVLTIKLDTGSEPSSRPAYFGSQHGLIDTPVITRTHLTDVLHGPLIVEEYDSTVVVPPGWSARLGSFSAIHLESER
jgi:N-methylhydantoinase A